ncbi:hypothetical protein ACI65C_002144 [Semiaphis heraclei]
MTEKNQVFSIFNCSKKQKLNDATKNENDNISSCSNTICKENVSSRIEQSINIVKEDNSLNSESLASHTQQRLYDIANFVVDHALKPSEIANCLKFAWRPSPDYAFPQKIEGSGKNQRNRKFKYNYLELYPWLAYSEIKNGAFCKWCILFAFSGGGIGKQKLGKLVTQPMVKYKDAMADLLEHSKKDYHILSGKRVHDFLAYYESGGKIGIDVVLSDHMSQIVEHNRKRLIPIIKTILFCAQNNLALRGHRELGSLSECDVRKECLSVAVTCFSYTVQLSQVLQSKQQDLSKALNDVMIVREALEAIREDADKSFKEIMKNVTTIASELEIEIRMPRICGRQTVRNNVHAKDAEEYYKIVIFIPFLDNLILQLHSRFDKRLETIIPLEGLIPSNLSAYMEVDYMERPATDEWLDIKGFGVIIYIQLRKGFGPKFAD